MQRVGPPVALLRSRNCRQACIEPPRSVHVIPRPGASAHRPWRSCRRSTQPSAAPAVTTPLRRHERKAVQTGPSCAGPQGHCERAPHLFNSRAKHQESDAARPVRWQPLPVLAPVRVRAPGRRRPAVPAAPRDTRPPPSTWRAGAWRKLLCVRLVAEGQPRPDPRQTCTCASRRACSRAPRAHACAACAGATRSLGGAPR